MKIYGAPYPAPNPRRVRMYLAEKGITAPYEDVDLQTRGHKAPAFVEKNSLGQVPTMELDDGTVIAESVSICRYFEALNPEPPLFGATPAQQAHVDMWIRRIEFQLMGPIGQFWVLSHPLTARLGEQKFKDYGEANKRRAANAMKWLNGEIKDRDFIAGDAFTMADIIAECTIDFAKFVGIDIPEDCTALIDWRARMKA